LAEGVRDDLVVKNKEMVSEKKGGGRTMAVYYGQHQLGFDVEEALKTYGVLIGDRVHGSPAWPPLFNVVWCQYLSSAFQHAAENLSLPGTKGWDSRMVDGWVYIAVIEPKPQEVPERERLFRDRIRPLIDDPWGEWAKSSAEVMALYKPFMEVEIEKVSDVKLYDLFFDTWDCLRRWMQIHFRYDYGLHEIYHLLEVLCEEVTGIKPEDPTFAKLMAGYDNMLFRVDQEIWRLSTRAQELGVGDLFLTVAKDEEVMSGLKGSAAGRRWLTEWEGFVKAHGWRRARVWDWVSPTWIEKPSLGFPEVREYLTGGAAFAPAAVRDRLAKEREEVEKQVMAKVPAAQKAWFEKLLRATQMSGSWTEEHNYYLDLMGHAVHTKVIRELGKRFAKDGVTEHPDDIHMLMPWEIQSALIVRERYDVHKLVKERRAEYNRYLAKEPAPIFGSMEKFGEVAIKDAVIRTVAAPPIVRPELKADLYGAGSAPGVVEGLARVVMKEEELKQLRPGEVLVTPITTAGWTYVFSIASAVVTDIGGILTHAVIVGREAGIPAVAGTMDATKKIRTGDRIRVDGNMNVVYIVKKAA
jgi:phosphohistidine swiveling domain-containing protein